MKLRFRRSHLLILCAVILASGAMSSLNFRDSDINFNSPIDMRGNEITSLADPSQSDSAAPASWTGDNFVNKSGDNITGDLNLNENQITNLSNPDDPGDVPTKEYVDASSSGGQLGYQEVVSFREPNSSHNFTVPEWAGEIEFVVIGGSGGDGGRNDNGGAGGAVNGTIPVSGGENLTLYVGEIGEDANGRFGGFGGGSQVDGFVQGGRGGNGFDYASNTPGGGGGGGGPSAISRDGNVIAVGEGGGGGQGEDPEFNRDGSGGGGGGARGGSGGSGGNENGDPGEGSGDGGDGGDGAGEPGGTYTDSVVENISSGTSYADPVVKLFVRNKGGKILSSATYRDTCWDTDWEGTVGEEARASCEVRCPDNMEKIVEAKYSWSDSCNDDYTYRCTPGAGYGGLPSDPTVEEAVSNKNIVWGGKSVNPVATETVRSGGQGISLDAYAEVAARAVCRGVQ